MMEVNDWDAAKEALFQAVENGHRKTKGKAAHNLAVIFEIEGNFGEAKAWHRKPGESTRIKIQGIIYTL